MPAGIDAAARAAIRREAAAFARGWSTERTTLANVGYKPLAQWSKGARLIAWWLSWIPATLALVAPLWWLPKTALFVVLACLPIGFGYILDASREET